MFWWEFISRAFREALDFVGGTPGAIVVWIIGAIVTGILVLVFRGKDAFMEHLKANILIVVGGAIATWLVVFAWKLAWLPHDIHEESARITVPASVSQRLRPRPPEFAYMHEPSKLRTLSLSRIEVTNFTGVPVRNKFTNKPGYFFNVFYENKGSIVATMLARKGKAEYPDHLLSPDELNAIQRQINEAPDGPLDSYQEIQPGPPGQFFSFPLESDAGEMVGPAQDALGGKTRLYLFFQMKYRDADKPSGRVKVTYFCGWFLDTFAMWHNCGTKIYSMP
jgi:hypothetical protein